ncbi:MAG: hypothetical protein E6K19_08160 [Methanobacteriota archaeon]|nr:MAG: hypothetical protein E6K19_08160 [Euryarchaeota archaeon]
MEPIDSSKQGLLQLTFARHAHGYGILGATALLLNTILLLTLGSPPPTLPGGIRVDLILYLLPAVAGALASWDAVRLKRAPYRSHYVSGHFAVSTAGMLLFFITALSIIIVIRQSPPEWLLPLLYPVAVSGVPLTIVSMGMTWQGISSRKLGSVAAALVLPVVMSVLWLLPVFGILDYTPDSPNWLNLRAVIFLTGALTMEISGSLLHIIASSTSVYQREILKADNSKVEQSDVASREAAMEKGTAQLQDLDRKVAATRAETEAKAEEMRLRESDLATLKKELDRTKQAFAAREVTLAEREKEVKRASIELTSKVRGSETKLKSIEERETRLQESEKSLDGTRTTLLKKEKELDLKDSELRMKGERLEATHSAGEATRLRELKDWEQKILAKEKELGKQEVELRTMEQRLRTQYENATRIDKQFQGQRRSMEDRESEFVSREKAIADQETALRQRAAELERQAASVDEAQQALDTKSKKYSDLFKDQKMKEAAVGSNAEDIRRQKEALGSREKKLAEMQANLQSEIKRLNEENRALMERAKEVEEKESDVQLRALELETKAREGRAGGATPGMRDMDREGQLEAWETRLREREEELKRHTYQKEKEMEMGEGAPFNSNVLFVGPAFVGKEVLLLNFIAEGLKKGVPAIIITTTKLPVDISKDIAPILPTFVEYDQLGLVRWIDCTSPIASGKPTREKNVWRVNGPTDFENIYQIVSQLDEEFKKKYPYFRLAYLTLSSSITQADEREAMTFFQRIVNRLRQTKAVSVIALERGMHNDQTLEALEHMVDGAIHFKSDKQKTMLQVNGLGEVQTHDWVPYKHTNKAIMIGSFQLERIR